MHARLLILFEKQRPRLDRRAASVLTSHVGNDRERREQLERVRGEFQPELLGTEDHAERGAWRVRMLVYTHFSDYRAVIDALLAKRPVLDAHPTPTTTAWRDWCALVGDFLDDLGTIVLGGREPFVLTDLDEEDERLREPTLSVPPLPDDSE